VRFETAVYFQCPKCGEAVRTAMDVPEPLWSSIRGASDPVSGHATVVVCPKCYAEFAAHASGRPSECKVSLKDHPFTTVVADTAWFTQDFDDDQFDYCDTPLDDPYKTYCSSYQDCEELLDEFCGDGDYLINRMLFTHHITALEAYLADTLIKAVEVDDQAFYRLLQHTELGKEKFTLAQINTDPNFVKRRVISYLRSVMWHNLSRANTLYNIVFRKDLLAFLGREHWTELVKAIEYRHDCVHRNGWDQNGVRLNVFTKEYIVHIGNVITSLVQQIEGVPY
jgi:hypothetical protein